MRNHPNPNRFKLLLVDGRKLYAMISILNYIKAPRISGVSKRFMS